jgi:hypothetical protein
VVRAGSGDHAIERPVLANGPGALPHSSIGRARVRRRSAAHLGERGGSDKVVEDFDKPGSGNGRGFPEDTLATINFSIPDDIKREFQKTFAGENKSAIVAALMRRAVEERRQQRRREAAIDSLLLLRRRVAPASDQEIRRARESGRL